ncbi:hypothetical protein GOODEAATRI_024526 [Goodea atripinnis]|uniref:Uncharacterized protein n=1 Tax=Goodea atripinnis TaxID=208336 RepID=A0ABV0MKE7_9TELE
MPPPPEAADGLPESLQGQPVVLLHGLTELLPGPGFLPLPLPWPGPRHAWPHGTCQPPQKSHKPTTADRTPFSAPALYLVYLEKPEEQMQFLPVFSALLG